MMMASTVSSIVQERISGLKHLQILSGMQKTSYWVANFIFDFAKFQTVMSITVLAMWIVEVNVEVTYYVFLTVSFALIPFAYATSFLFSSEAAAQILTMFLNFYVISIL
jgi:ATP-binding cassette subfamily A (ABC1) protein 3